MGFIYKITNKINGKSYIGKTEQTVEKRFKEHISDARNKAHMDRPLYRAIRKYGIENFIIETLEECDNAVEREVFWIKHYNTFGNSGYNATIGGDGKPWINIPLVLAALEFNDYRCARVSDLLGYSVSSIKEIADKFGIKTAPRLFGEAVPNAKLTEQNVRDIRKLYVPKKFGKRKISRLLGLPLHAVDHVIKGQSWKHVDQ